MAVVVMIIGMYVVSLYVDPGIREAAGSSSVQTMLAAQITGRAPMTALQIVVFVGELVLLAAVGVLIFFAWRRTRGTKSRVDDRARDMTRVKDMSELGSKAAKKDAERLEATSAGDGVPLGKLVNNMSVFVGLVGVGSDLDYGTTCRQDQLRVCAPNSRN